MKRLLPLLACLALSACSYEMFMNGQPVRLTFGEQPPTDAHANVLIHGDSIIAKWDTLPPSIANTGFGGNSTAILLYRFPGDVLSQHPDIIVLEGGINDLAQGVPIQDAANNMGQMIAAGQASGAQVLVMACLPTRYPQWDVATYNTALRAVAGTYGAAVMDTYTPFLKADGSGIREELYVEGSVHINAAGYAVLWGAIRPYLPRDAY